MHQPLIKGRGGKIFEKKIVDVPAAAEEPTSVDYHFVLAVLFKCKTIGNALVAVTAPTERIGFYIHTYITSSRVVSLSSMNVVKGD
jgi:hypothetical protein